MIMCIIFLLGIFCNKVVREICNNRIFEGATPSPPPPVTCVGYKCPDCWWMSKGCTVLTGSPGDTTCASASCTNDECCTAWPTGMIVLSAIFGIIGVIALILVFHWSYKQATDEGGDGRLRPRHQGE